MLEDTKKIGQLVKAKTSSLQKTSSNIISRGLSDLSLLTIESDDLKYTQSDAKAYNNRGPVLWFDAAIEGYDKAIALDPNDAVAYNNRGLAYANKGQHDRAIEDYNKAIQLNPNDALTYSARGNAYSNKGQYDRAIEDYNKAIQLDPNDAAAYAVRGIAYYKKGNMGRAISDLQKACDMGFQLGCKSLQIVLENR